MKTPQQWTKERDFIGGEYDMTLRMEHLIAMIQKDARRVPLIVLTMVVVSVIAATLCRIFL